MKINLIAIIAAGTVLSITTPSLAAGCLPKEDPALYQKVLNAAVASHNTPRGVWYVGVQATPDCEAHYVRCLTPELAATTPGHWQAPECGQPPEQLVATWRAPSAKCHYEYGYGNATLSTRILRRKKCDYVCPVTITVNMTSGSGPIPISVEYTDPRAAQQKPQDVAACKAKYGG